MQDNLGDRMKGYESCAQSVFIKRMPVIFRLDGKGFSKYTKPLKNSGLPDPFNRDMKHIMQVTLQHLCGNIQNVVFGYTQSDEISLYLKDWTEYETQQWFGGKQSKIESISASMATAVFNNTKARGQYCPEVNEPFAMFDSRAFNIPREDVTNYFLWRQKDCTRNSVSMLAQHYFSHKRLQGQSVDQMKKMLQTNHNISWDNLEDWKKYGMCWAKDIGVFDASKDFQTAKENIGGY